MRYYRIATGGGPRWAREDGGTPTKVVAIGLNYRDHAAEVMKPLPTEPLCLLKPPSAVIGPGEAIRKPAWVVFPAAHLVWFASRVMTLLPGDIISTETPAGISPLQAGDRVEVEFEGVGVLANPVTDR